MKTNYPLTLLFSPQDKELELIINYDKDCFDDYVIKQLSCHFNTILLSIVENFNKPVSHLSYLSQHDVYKVINDFKLPNSLGIVPYIYLSDKSIEVANP